MYNILIIDDDEKIYKDFQSIVEKSQYGDIGDIYFASCASEAKDAVKNLHPSIVIIDIQMSGIIDLHLVKQITEIYSDIKFIALSAYDDIKHVREAFASGAVDYLLKSQSIKDIMVTLDRTIKTIKRERQDILDQKSKTNRYMQAILENTFNKIFAGLQYPVEKIENMLKDINITFQYSFFCIGIISYRNLIESADIEEAKYLFEGAVTDGGEVTAINFYNLNNYLVLLFNLGSRTSQKQLKKYLEMVVKKQCGNIDKEPYISMSEYGIGIGSITTCYTQAIEALSYKIVCGPNKVIEYSDIKNMPDANDSFERELLKLKEYILNYKMLEINNLIDGLFEENKIEHRSIQYIQRLYSDIISVVNESVNDNWVESYNKYRKMNSFNSLCEIRIYLKTIVLDATKLLKNRNKENSISSIVKNYVKANYAKGIDMAVVSNLVSISYSHFSKIFKDETGMNFSDYLTRIRMEKALEKLNNPVFKIQDVAINVGYSNPKHFTRAFKNYYGFSPTEYRCNVLMPIQISSPKNTCHGSNIKYNEDN